MKGASERDFDAAFATIDREGVGALVVAASSLLFAFRDRLIALVARRRIPSIYPYRELADAGGLMTYGSSLTDAMRQVGVYTGRILKGERPADLPALLPTKFEFIINHRTAKALGLTIPETLLATADEVIE